MNPNAWLDHKFSGEYFSGNLEHLKQIIRKFDLIPTKSKIITIGGTNGKGQTSRLIGKRLKSLSQTYLLWTSPHLFSVNERIEFNGELYDEGELTSIFIELESLLVNTHERLSYFEFLFLAFLLITKKKCPEFLLLEVGLGGRLDAVNALDADYFVLTSISRDHQEVLGKTFKKILYEKLGVLRSKQVVISTIELRYLRQIISLETLKLNCEWSDLFDKEELNTEDHFSKRNTMLANFVVRKALNTDAEFNLGSDVEAFRLNKKLNNAMLYFYPSHNIDGIRKLVQFLSLEGYNKIDFLVISFSKRDLTDIRVMLRIFFEAFPKEKIALMPFQHQKALAESDLNKIMDEFKLNVFKIEDLISYSQNDPSKSILITGSNYFLGEFYHKLKSIC